MQYTLKELRARNNISQEKLAQMLGITTNTYIKIEADPQRCKLCHFMKIAEILNVSMSDIKIV